MITITLILLFLSIHRLFKGIPFYNTQQRLYNILTNDGETEDKVLGLLGAIPMMLYIFIGMIVDFVFLSFAFGYAELQLLSLAWLIFYIIVILIAIVHHNNISKPKRYSLKFFVIQFLWISYLVYVLEVLICY